MSWQLQISTDVLFYCSGFNARPLTNDFTFWPIQGRCCYNQGGQGRKVSVFSNNLKFMKPKAFKNTERRQDLSSCWWFSLIKGIHPAPFPAAAPSSDIKQEIVIALASENRRSSPLWIFSWHRDALCFLAFSAGYAHYQMPWDMSIMVVETRD